jgi:hypothetical protein
MNHLKPGNAKSALLNAVLSMGIAALIIALGSFAYLGTFTRYLADDYCETVLAESGSVLHALAIRYQTISDRYSNLLFEALSEFVFPRNIQVMPIVMIVLWTVALIWLAREIKLIAGLDWPFAVDLFLGTFLSFFSILEAPNRFQTIYWRSAMSTHFAPLVYLAAMSALILRQTRKTEGAHSTIWSGPLFLALAFIGGGFSEPPDAMLIVFSALALIAIVILEKGPRRRPAISSVSWTLAGGLIALLVMALSPGNSFRLNNGSIPRLADLVTRTLLYVVQFILNSFATLPIPSLLSVAMPCLLFYYLFQSRPMLSPDQRKKTWTIMLATPVLAYILIAASFAPSVYGQSFPEERARFAGQLTLIVSLMIEGACFGVAMAQIRLRRQSVINFSALGLLAVMSAFYPLRAAGNVLKTSLPVYREWTSQWDARQLQISAEKARGIQNLVVQRLPGLEYIKELDLNSTYWVNRCAAQFYGVQSISATDLGKP